MKSAGEAMSRKGKNKTPKSMQRKHASEAEISPMEAATGLRNEIVDEVKALAQAKIRSVYGLIEKGKELIELEKQSEASTGQVPTGKAQTANEELTVSDL